MKKQHIIIGASAAGLIAARTLAQLEPESQVLCLSDEPVRPYNTCFLADFVAGHVEEDKLYLDNFRPLPSNLSLMTGVTVERIVPELNYVVCSDGKKLSYDTLFLGTGATPWLPSFAKNISAQGLFTFHTYQDAQAVMSVLDGAKKMKAIVIGGGLTGLETADALAHKGVKVTVVEAQKQFLSHFISSQASEVIEGAMDKVGVAYHLDTFVDRILIDNGNVVGVELVGGGTLAADMVIVATGVRPSSDLARDAGIKLRNDAIVVDEFMRTNVKNIYAGGDVASVRNTVTGAYMRSCTWQDAVAQGRVAGYTMAGKEKKYMGTVPTISTHFFGLQLMVCGATSVDAVCCEVHSRQTEDSYAAAFVDGHTIKGFTTLGPKIHVGPLRRAVIMQQQVTRQQIDEMLCSQG